MKVLNAAARRPNWASATMIMRIVIQIMVIFLSCVLLCGVGGLCVGDLRAKK